MGKIAIEEESDMIVFLEQAKALILALGIHALVPVEAKEYTSVNPLLHFKWKDGEATGRYVSGTFIVYKGSRIRSGSTASCPSGALRLREKYAD